MKETTLAPIRPILRIADICDLLRISEAQFYVLKARGFFDRHGLLVEVQPVIDDVKRYSGAPFVEFLSQKNQSKLLRATLREVTG